MLLLLFVIVMLLAYLLQANVGFRHASQRYLGPIRPDALAAWTRKQRPIASEESAHQGG